jgi:hypothetical protein
VTATRSSSIASCWTGASPRATASPSSRSARRWTDSWVSACCATSHAARLASSPTRAGAGHPVTASSCSRRSPCWTKTCRCSRRASTDGRPTDPPPVRAMSSRCSSIIATSSAASAASSTVSPSAVRPRAECVRRVGRAAGHVERHSRAGERSVHVLRCRSPADDAVCTSRSSAGPPAWRGGAGAASPQR